MSKRTVIYNQRTNRFYTIDKESIGNFSKESIAIPEERISEVELNALKTAAKTVRDLKGTIFLLERFIDNSLREVKERLNIDPL